MESRGSPPYLAPELFTNEGVHSYQSDFWCFGCLLYELRRGFPPFGFYYYYYYYYFINYNDNCCYYYCELMIVTGKCY
jgi:serine/threonine protein kinase